MGGCPRRGRLEALVRCAIDPATGERRWELKHLADDGRSHDHGVGSGLPAKRETSWPQSRTGKNLWRYQTGTRSGGRR